MEFLTIQKIDTDGNLIADTLDELLAEEAPGRNFFKREVVKAKGINGNTLTAYKSGMLGEAKIRENLVTHDRADYLEQLYLDSVNNNKHYRLTFTFGRTVDIKIADIDFGAEGFNYVEYVELTVRAV
ncbi:hypothetical protein ACKXGF_07535 [Alkalibacillus sp. S2W]|uniref:hypothetical protein n=1 Tax=Alkalibacillus sp. S2W TaxID=3386553 RepID=UPI00398CABE9